MKINQIINEFVTPQATAQDPGLEREKDVDVIFYGQMPRDFTADTVAEALEAVLPREYPPGSSLVRNSNVYRVVTEIAKHQGAVVTTKPLSIAQKLVKTFQTYGIKCRINAPGLDEDITRRGFLQGAGAVAAAAAGGSAMAQSQMPKVDQVDRQKMTIVLDGQEYPLVILSATDFRPRGGQPVHITCAQMGERCMGRYDALLTQGRVFVLPGMKPPIVPQGVEEGFVDTVKDKYAQFKDYFDDSPEAVERKLARLRATNAEAQPGANATAPVAAQSAEDPYMILGIEHGADSNAIKLAYRRLAKKHHPDTGGSAAEFQKIKDAFNQLLSSGAVVREGTSRLPQPEDFESDNDYYDALDAYGKPQDTDSDYENWAVDESREKVGNMDADAFDVALARMKKLAGAGPLKTVYDPTKRVYKNVPQAVQPAQQPRKEKK